MGFSSRAVDSSGSVGWCFSAVLGRDIAGFKPGNLAMAALSMSGIELDPLLIPRTWSLIMKFGAACFP